MINVINEINPNCQFSYRNICYESVVRCKQLPSGSSGKSLSCQCKRLKRLGFNPWVGKILWRMAWQPTPVLLPREFHGQRSSAGYSPRGHTELATIDVTKQQQHDIMNVFPTLKINTFNNSILGQ